MAPTKFVIVSWHDAKDQDGTWSDLSTAETFGQESCLVHSGGFLVSTTDKYVTLAGDYIPGDNDCGRVTKIPKGVIINIRDLCTIDTLELEPSCGRDAPSAPRADSE